MKKLLFVSAIAALVGCATRSDHGYIDNNDNVFGDASKLEYTEKSRSVAQSVERLLTDPTFTAKYDKARKSAADAGRALPTITLKPIENNADARSDAEATGQLYRDLLTALRKTGKFEVIDPMRRKKMTETVIAGNNAGEDSSALQHIGEYAAPDFVMMGELRREVTDDERRRVYHHFLNLQLSDTASGTVFWSDTVRVTKFAAH